MSKTADLRNELKKRFFPLLESRGFIIDKSEQPVFTTFRKHVGNKTYTCSLQWEKYGRPRFLISIGTCTGEGVTHHGRHIGPEAVHPNDTQDFAYLKPLAGVSTSSWFRQDRGILKSLLTGVKLDPSNIVVDQLIALFPEAETYFEKGIAGKHVFKVF
jgi:hypothetical protein